MTADDEEAPPASSPFELLASKQIYRNPWISVREDQVVRPGGSKGIFGVVTMKAGSSVLAITEDLQTFLTSEYKYAVGRLSLEVASGAIEEGEEPLDAARRELEEELGIQAGEWLDMGTIDPFTTVISSPNHMFLALGLTFTSQRLDVGEVLSVVRIPFLQAVEKVLSGEISHAASAVLILKAHALLRGRGVIP